MRSSPGAGDGHARPGPDPGRVGAGGRIGRLADPTGAGAITGLALVVLALRAFSSGCTALTGVEAISNGVPAFRKPKSANAATTMVAMGVIAVTMFAGVTALALISDVHFAEDTCNLVGFPGDCESQPQRTVIAQIAAAVFGGADSMGFFFIQAATAAILILAANTAYNGFPQLASILAQHRYLPRQLHTRGDRLAFSNGIVLLALVAGLLLYAFDASVTRLIQLYILGVFTSFTLSQTGMVRHWNRLLAAETDPAQRRSCRPAGRQRHRRRGHRPGPGDRHRDQVHPGCVAGGRHLPLLFALMRGFAATTTPSPASSPRHPTSTSRFPHECTPSCSSRQSTNPRCAHSAWPAPSAHTSRGAHRQRRPRRHRRAAAGMGTPRDSGATENPRLPLPGDHPALLDYVKHLRRESPRDVVIVFIPEYVVGHWWEQLLHNQSALRLKARLLFTPGVMVTNVPWRLASSALADKRPEPHAPGELRRTHPAEHRTRQRQRRATQNRKPPQTTLAKRTSRMRRTIEPRVDTRIPIDSHRPYTTDAPRTDGHSWRPSRLAPARPVVVQGAFRCHSAVLNIADDAHLPVYRRGDADYERKNPMRHKTRWIAGGAISLAIIGAGTGIGLAATTGDDRGPDGGPLSGSTLERAVDAALDATGGGTVTEAEFADDGGTYSVEVRRGNGSHVEVKLDENFTVLGQGADDDGTTDSDGGNDD